MYIFSGQLRKTAIKIFKNYTLPISYEKNSLKYFGQNFQKPCFFDIKSPKVFSYWREKKSILYKKQVLVFKQAKRKY